MKKLKLFASMMIGLATFALAAPSYSEGRVFGNIGIIDPPLSILVGYNDYGRHYYQPRRIEEHHHYYHKPRHKYRSHARHYYKPGHGHAYGHNKQYPRYYYRDYYRGGYCPY